MTIFLILSLISVTQASNLTCYQCVRHSDTQCSPQDLKPCAEKHDRCVTHISKSVQNGYTIRRECGLAPCSFDDDIVNKGLGMGECDTNKDNFFCVFCCKENACNKSSIQINLPLKTMFIILLIKLII